MLSTISLIFALISIPLIILINRKLVISRKQIYTLKSKLKDMDLLRKRLALYKIEYSEVVDDNKNLNTLLNSYKSSNVRLSSKNKVLSKALIDKLPLDLT